MRFSTVAVTLLALLAVACSAPEAQPDHQSEWRDVLRHKRSALAADANADLRQAYADSVRAFVEKHPEHRRAREVWQSLQLEFAGDLAAAGRNQEAIRFYRAVLAHDPRNADATRGLATAVSRLAVSREKLLELHKGMTRREVASLLGQPLPGWTITTRRPEATFEAWYYRNRGGGVAAVYFRDGKVFAAEEQSHAKVGSLGG